jgi:hypothetical protein
MIEDMQIRNLTLNTQRVYVEQVGRFARAETGPERQRRGWLGRSCA